MELVEPGLGAFEAKGCWFPHEAQLSIDVCHLFYVGKRMPASTVSLPKVLEHQSAGTLTMLCVATA